VIHLRRGAAGRRLSEIRLLCQVAPGTIQAVSAWRLGAGAGPGGRVLARLLAERGVAPPPSLTVSS